MTWRIVDLTQDGRYLHTQGQWVVVKEGQEELGRVPLVDIQSVIAHAEHATYSQDLFRKLAESGIPFVVCDRKHNPVAVLLPLSNHHLHAGRAQAQARASLPMRKRIWRELVKAKITEQSRTLAKFELSGASALKSLCKRVRSGDPDNVEARAARMYWGFLFGSDFRRNRCASDLNVHLNYGYTVLRSALARAIVETGLVPAIGVGHVNARNNFCLVDDLIEPFRPLVDRLVWSHREKWIVEEFAMDHRIALAGIMQGYVQMERSTATLYKAMTVLTVSLAAVFEGNSNELTLPTTIELLDPAEA